jgi:hypothetical protein
MSLKPQNIVHAAEADLKRKARNKERVLEGDYSYEQYAFHRLHVRKSNTAHDLIKWAIAEPGIGKPSAKRNTRLIYGDMELLTEAMRSFAE